MRQKKAGIVVFLLLWAILFGAIRAQASVIVKGPPEWLSNAIKESIIAVMREMPSYDLASQERLLAMVSDRIFEGYKIKSLSVKSKDDVFVEFVPTKLADWKVKVTAPRLNSPCDEWFRQDALGLEEILLSMVQGVPIEALKWADEVFLKEVKK